MLKETLFSCNTEFMNVIHTFQAIAKKQMHCLLLNNFVFLMFFKQFSDVYSAQAFFFATCRILHNAFYLSHKEI